MRFNREPAAWLNAFAAGVALLVGLGAFGLVAGAMRRRRQTKTAI